MQIWRNFSVFILSASLIVACSKDNKSNDSKVLRTDLGGNVGTLDPQGAFDPYTFHVLSDLYEGIVDMDQANNPIAGMAESWTVSDDGLTYDFYLRHDLKFSDGSSISADDFVYSWRRMIDPETAGYAGTSFGNILNALDVISHKLPLDNLGVEAIDQYQFRVNLSKPDPAFIEKCTALFTTVVPKQVIDKYGESWTSLEHIVTSGPYKLSKRVINGEIMLEKNPYYYNAKNVKMESVIYIPYQDRNSALSAYKTEELDILNGVPVDQYAKLKSDYAKQLNTVGYEGVVFFSLNVFSDKLKDTNVREALSLAVDRDVLTNKILASGQKPLYSYVTPTVENGRYKNVYYDWKSLTQAERDAKAKELLKDSGIEPQKYSINLTYDNNDINRKVAVAVASMWEKELGIKVNLMPTVRKDYLDKRKNSDFEVLLNSWGAAFNHVTTYTPEYACASNVNVSRLCTVNYDSLITDANMSLNEDQQTQFYERALQLAMEQYAIIPLYQNSYTMMISPKVSGLNVESNLLHDIRSKWISKQ